MINIRFHIVSLVAVFLALGVGVAMGASFIDRVTVESMQGRVDDLETGFRDRGAELESYGDMVSGTDEAAVALGEQDSRAIDAALQGEQVVLLVPNGLPDGSLEVLSTVLGNSGADIVGTVDLQPALAEPAEGSGNGPAATEPNGRAEALAEALAALSVAAPDPPAEPVGPDPTADAQAAARTLLEDYSEAGLVALDAAGQPSETAFPAAVGVRYLLAVAAGTEPPADDWLVPFVEAYGGASSATMLVAGVADARDAGELPAEPEEGDELPALLEPIRSGAASNEVSSVQFATEPLARLAVVYGFQALAEDVVGHYGLGEGVATPYPPVVRE